MFLVLDYYSDYQEVKNYPQLKELLVEDVVRDTKENISDTSIVERNIDILKNLTNDKYKLEYIKEELNAFGWKIIDINAIKTNVCTLKEYLSGKNIDTNVFDELIALINKEVK